MPRNHHVYPTDAAGPLSQTIVYAAADATGVDPTEFDETLADCLDPDALDRVFESGGPGTTVSFTFADCRVVVEDGVVTVTPVSDDRNPGRASA
ncbi:HalOD1 output domain-containing protein [Haloarcula litorea]|uniref:HalOD1 output domain-containing protein n=1 Tax=Haloarcula litorea TaxID=3032579 RepID=UPI0023E77D32|nr:HalOD1 output domain-containing protein [Halomicroarcula sp. GDY20]